MSDQIGNFNCRWAGTITVVHHPCPMGVPVRADTAAKDGLLIVTKGTPVGGRDKCRVKKLIVAEKCFLQPFPSGSEKRAEEFFKESA